VPAAAIVPSAAAVVLNSADAGICGVNAGCRGGGAVDVELLRGTRDRVERRGGRPRIGSVALVATPMLLKALAAVPVTKSCAVAEAVTRWSTGAAAAWIRDAPAPDAF
jgi:hypothetical protein